MDFKCRTLRLRCFRATHKLFWGSQDYRVPRCVFILRARGVYRLMEMWDFTVRFTRSTGLISMQFLLKSSLLYWAQSDGSVDRSVHTKLYYWKHVSPHSVAHILMCGQKLEFGGHRMRHIMRASQLMHLTAKTPAQTLWSESPFSPIHL